MLDDRRELNNNSYCAPDNNRGVGEVVRLWTAGISGDGLRKLPHNSGLDRGPPDRARNIDMGTDHCLYDKHDEADISEGPLADPMHVENHGRGPGDPIDENHVGDHMVRGPGDAGKHIDAVFIDQGKDRRRVVGLAEVLINIYMTIRTTLTNRIHDMSNIVRTARLFTEKEIVLRHSTGGSSGKLPGSFYGQIYKILTQ